MSSYAVAFSACMVSFERNVVNAQCQILKGLVWVIKRVGQLTSSNPTLHVGFIVQTSRHKFIQLHCKSVWLALYSIKSLNIADIQIAALEKWGGGLQSGWLLPCVPVYSLHRSQWHTAMVGTGVAVTDHIFSLIQRWFSINIILFKFLAKQKTIVCTNFCCDTG